MEKTEVNIGRKINKLTIIKEVKERVRRNGKTRRVFLCRCECGIEKKILWQSLSTGRTNSCGCYQKKMMKNAYAKKHGLSHDYLFSVWRKMIARCYDKNHKGYKYYGAEGVTVCKSWLKNPHTFRNWALKNGWEKGRQLDKDKFAPKTGKKIYSPKHCCFLTPNENRKYRRKYRSARLKK